MAIADEQQERDDTAQRFQEHCREFPQDEYCASDEPPVLLSQREGLPFKCYLAPQNLGQSKSCKVLVEDEQLVIFLETEDKIKFLKNKKNTQEIRISLPDVFSFDSQWWVADVGRGEDSVGMFFDIQVGYLSRSSEQNSAQTNFLTIFAPAKRKKELSNENIPKIVEQIEPWLYYRPDLTAFKSQLLSSVESESKPAEVTKNVERLLETNECPECDLRNADLTDANLIGANLEGANLEGANLAEVNLTRAYLLGANLKDTDLQQGNLNNATLMFASLKNADLTQASLKAANFTNANLQNANLTQAKLNRRGLNITQFQNADLSDANLTEANLRCANFQNANLANANLTQVSSKKCKFNISLYKGELSNFLLNGAVINTPVSDVIDIFRLITYAVSEGLNSSTDSSSSSSRNAPNIGGRVAEFRGETNFTNANLSGANFTKAKLDRINFSDANLNHTNLSAVELKNANLSNATVIDANLTGVELQEFNLCQTIMPDLSFSEQGCFEPTSDDIAETESDEETTDDEP